MCGKLTKRTNEKDTYSFLCFAQCVWENAVLVELQKAGSYIRYNKILHTSKINKQSNVQYINKRTDCKHQYKLKICKHETIKLIDIWTNKVAVLNFWYMKRKSKETNKQASKRSAPNLCKQKRCASDRQHNEALVSHHHKNLCIL